MTPQRRLWIVYYVVHADILELILKIFGALEIFLFSYNALIAVLGRSPTAFFWAKAAEVLADCPLELGKSTLPSHDLLATPVRWAERFGCWLVPSRAIIDLHGTILYIVVFVCLIKVSTVHASAINRLTRVYRIATNVLCPKVAQAEELLMLRTIRWLVHLLIACSKGHTATLEEFLTLIWHVLKVLLRSLSSTNVEHRGLVHIWVLRLRPDRAILTEWLLLKLPLGIVISVESCLVQMPVQVLATWLVLLSRDLAC